MATAKLTKDQAVELQKLLDAFDKARSDLSEWVDGLVAEWDDAINDRSEEWQDGEAGQAATERKDQLATLSDEIPESPMVDIAALS